MCRNNGTRIRKKINIQGVKKELKQFADDCSCFLKNIESIYTLIDCIEGFSLQSGLKLNSEKSILFFSWTMERQRYRYFQYEY